MVKRTRAKFKEFSLIIGGQVRQSMIRYDTIKLS